MKIGEVGQYKVIRESDFAYILFDGEEEYFLHKSEGECQVDDVVEAFLYFDREKRPTATLSNPVLTKNQVGFLRVVEKRESLGIFVSNNVKKDVLVFKEDLPYNFIDWPEIDDLFFGQLVVTNQSLIFKPVRYFDKIKSHGRKFEVGNYAFATVCKIVKAGIGLVTDCHQYIFVHKNHLRTRYRVGQSIDVRIIGIKDDGTYTGTLIQNKEFMIDTDSEKIYDYIKKNKKLHFNKSTSSEDIYKLFNMSKKAYKRAIGKLYKERKIEILDEYVKLNEE